VRCRSFVVRVASCVWSPSCHSRPLLSFPPPLVIPAPSCHSRPPLVIPAKAGIQATPHRVYAVEWIPAFAGMTQRGGNETKECKADVKGTMTGRGVDFHLYMLGSIRIG